MSAWCQAMMDGVSYLIESFSGSAEKAVQSASSNLPPNIRSKMPSFDGLKNNRPSPNKQQPTSPENINKGETQRSNNSGLEIFKNPQVAKGVRSVYADYRMRQYEKAGVLDECIRQRKERLGEIPPKS